MRKRRVVETIDDLSNETFNRRIRRMLAKELVCAIVVIFFCIWLMVTNLNDFRQFQTEREQSRDFFNAIIMMILGIVYLGTVFYNQRRRGKDRKELFETYPELDDELSNLLEADYIDEDLRILIYGHHLVSTAQLQTLDLEQCQALETVSTNVPRTGGLVIYSIKATLYNGETKSIAVFDPIYLNVEKRLEALYDFIYNAY